LEQKKWVVALHHSTQYVSWVLQMRMSQTFILQRGNLPKEVQMSTFSTRYPDFAAVEKQVRRAQAQRSVAIAAMIAESVMATMRGLRRLVGVVDSMPPTSVKPLVVKARLSV
jgi:glutamate-1-semialdehyde aminotransferase